MKIKDLIAKRGITEVVHFTSHLGLTGVLATKALKCKDQLKKEQYLAHILKINTQKELDPGWSGHVHLSLTRINSWLFGISSGNWHKDVGWRILAFDPEIMTHPDVHFVTTNNAYWQHHKRGKGSAALEELFADTVNGRYGVAQKRSKKQALNLTTCEQAEVLYPGSVSTDFLRRIYVKTADDENEVAAQLYATGFTKIEVVADPKKFVGLDADE
ncbi:MAG: DarT ssDNA thymidine ADP-ribosyltransferase family protein [Verrucomicrobiota bacterium]